jgi:hypothetical protein
MRTHHTSRRVLLVPVLGLAFAAAITACSSSSSSSTSSATATTSAPASSTAATASATPTASATASATASPTASTEPATGAGATAAIKANWAAFFNGSTPIATRISLLQNGSQYSAIMTKVLGTPQAATAGATVQTVTITSATGANVGYTITLSGTPVLGGQKGTAVYQDGVWKVSVTSFCDLAALENSGKAVAGCP